MVLIGPQKAAFLGPFAMRWAEFCWLIVHDFPTASFGSLQDALPKAIEFWHPVSPQSVMSLIICLSEPFFVILPVVRE